MRYVLMVGLLFSAVASAVAEEPTVKKPVSPRLEFTKLKLHPTKVVGPALKHRLLPPLLERTQGNAAPIYYRCVITLLDGSSAVRKKYFRSINKWRKMPVDELPLNEVREMLNEYGRILREVEVAARRSYCRWDLPTSEVRENLFGILLPEVQESRAIGYLLSMRARLEIAEGNYEDAIKTLQTGYALARDIAKQPFIICDLVGIAIAKIMNDQLATLIGSPGAPNLYWALTTMPRPLIGTRESLDLESEGIFYVYPQLLAAKTETYTAEQWDIKLDECLAKLRQHHENNTPIFQEPDKELMDQLDKARIIDKINQARSGLPGFGYSKDEAEAMSAGQAILLYSALTFEDIRDEAFKWSYVHYPDRLIDTEALNRQIALQCKKREIIPIASSLLPAVGIAHRQVTRGWRQFEMLRVIEALRLYAAEHDNKFPPTLAGIKTVPIPKNPMTGKPFGYRLEGETAILEAADPVESQQIRYQLTIAK